MENTPCRECKNVGRRMPSLDVEGFIAFYCRHYKETVHDYFGECAFFTQKDTKEPTK